MVKYSFVIPVYEVRGCLSDCLMSLHRQTYATWEAVIVDDGSRDGSGLLVDDAVRSDPRIRVVHQRNSGVSVARNRALGRICGEWLCFVDPDDWIADTLLECLNGAVGSYPQAQMVHYRCRGGFSYYALPALRSPALRAERLAVASLLTAESFALYAYRRDVVSDMRFTPLLAHGEDILWVYEAMIRATHIVHMEECFYVIRTRPDSASNKPVDCRRAWNQCLFCRLAVELLARYEVEPPYQLLRRWILGAMEGSIGLLASVPSPCDRRGALRIWRETMAWLGRRQCMPVALRLRCAVAVRLRGWLPIYLFFGLPYRLKAIGLNRGAFRRLLRRLLP